MKEGWTYKKLGELCRIDFGTRVVRIRDAGSVFPVYGGGGATFKMDTFNREDCMVISRFGMSEQCTRFVKGKFFLNDSGLTLSMKNPCMIQEFMNWQILSLNNKIYSLGRGAAQKNLDTKALSELIISYPHNISEQKRIVSRLDAAFAHIEELKANAEKQLSDIHTLFQKALSKAMEPKKGWEVKTLKELSVISGDYGLSVPSKPFDGVRYLRITDITEWGDLNEDVVSAKLDEKHNKVALEEGDILFARTGATVGKTLVYKREFGECLFAGYLIRYRLNKNVITPRFMHYFTHSKVYYDWVVHSQEAAAQPNINAKKYNSLLINYPNLSEQQRIVERLDALSAHVRELEENQKKTIAECEAMKQALLRKVFE